MGEQGLVVVKDNFLTRITQTLKRFFFKGRMRDLLLDENNRPNIELIENNGEFIQQEIVDARRAFRKYVINNNKEISVDVLTYIVEKIEENEEKIKQIIEINNDDITYHEILEMVMEEKKNVSKFKSKNSKNGRYNVPIGVIGIECDNVRDSILSMLKAISTRNSVIILHENYSKYSTESLILLIIKECLKNFYIDDNIIQMFEKEEIDILKLDKIININGKSTAKSISNTIYIYQEDENYEEQVCNEVERLQNSDIYKSYEIKPIRGEFGDIVNYLNDNEASAVCMYTNNTQKAYKFINWINSPNVFVNTGIKNCNKLKINSSDYFNSKYILHEDVF